MSQVFLFSLTAMANPSLVAATTVMLLLPSPKRLMLGYLLGALLTSVTLGLVIVFALKGSTTVSTAKDTLNPALDLAVGGILLIVAVVLGTGRDDRLTARRRERKASKPDKGPPLWQQALSKGTPRTTFAVGVVLTLPGASYLADLTSISKLHAATAATVLLVLMVNVIMLALLEAPLIAFALAPERTPTAIDRTKAWFGRHARRIAIIAAAALGAAFILRGLITLLS